MRPEVYYDCHRDWLNYARKVPTQATDAWARGINKVLYGEAPPKGLNPFLPFLTEKVPSRLPPIADKWYPFHIRSQERIADLA